MFRFYPAAIAIGLTSFCTAAYSDPQIIQPTQQFAFAGAGSGGVAINGSLILVGAPHGGESPATTGTVYLYRRDDHCSGTLCWKPAGQMVRPDAVPDDRFGASIDFDGRTLVIGSPSFTPGSEAVYIYEREEDHFVFRQKLQGEPLNPNPGGYSNFGATAVLAGDRLAITQLPVFFPGSAYVFKRDKEGLWHREAQLQPADITIHDQFGVSVDLQGDTLISGSDTTGYAAVFYRHGAHWQEGPTLTIPDQAFNGGGGFGRSVALQGNQVAIGAYFSTDPSGSYNGSVYLFRRRGKDWRLQQQLLKPDDVSTNFFGAAVLFRRDRIAAADGAAIYLFQSEGRHWIPVAKLIKPAGFAVVDSLDSMDWNATTVVACTNTGVSIFDLPALAR